MAEAATALFSEKINKYGVLGAGLVSLDTEFTLRLAKSLEENEKVVAAAGYTGGSTETLAVPQQPPKSLVPAGPAPGLAEAVAAWNNKDSGVPLKREHVMEILDETYRVQAIVQQEISVLARELAEAKNGKKRRKPLTFLEGHKKIQELDLPHEPLEDGGESTFQQLLMQYQEDDDVMLLAGKLLHPPPKGSSETAKVIGIDRIIEIHKFMVKEMEKVLTEFKQLPEATRCSFTAKACETTAELLVSVAVEQQLSVRCEDVEQAVTLYEEALQQHPVFSGCTEQLATMMQQLVGSTQARITKDEFLGVLGHMGKCSKEAKVFSKKLYEDYRSKTCAIPEAYRRFEEFSDSMAPPDDLPDISQVEMQLCLDEYRDDAAVRQAWQQSGAEASMMLQSMMATGIFPPQMGGSAPSATEDRKKASKIKASDVIEMQELMVDELKRLNEATASALKKGGAEGHEWKPELLTQMIQALASAAVERRFNVSQEEMTMLGVQHAVVLQRNERFARATQNQQEILMQLPQLCQAASAS